MTGNMAGTSSQSLMGHSRLFPRPQVEAEEMTICILFPETFFLYDAETDFASHPNAK